MAAALTTMPVRSFSAVRVQRPVAQRPAARPALAARRALIARATPTQGEKSAVETAIDNAKETCEGGTSGECANAWDDVEELAQDAARKKARAEKKDPLEEFCDDNPDADECRVYED